jgi:hypothetical protein
MSSVAAPMGGYLQSDRFRLQVLPPFSSMLPVSAGWLKFQCRKEQIFFCFRLLVPYGRIMARTGQELQHWEIHKSEP